MPRRRFPFRTALLLSTLTAGAFGDLSAGYYCSTPDYLACEHQGMTTTADGTSFDHSLQVVWLGGKDGLLLREVKLPNFDIQGLKCYPAALEMVSQTSVYSVDLKDKEHPRLVRTRYLASPGVVPPGFKLSPVASASTVVESVGMGSHTVSTPLPTTDKQFHYALALTESRPLGQAGAGSVEYSVIQKDLSGKMIQRAVLFKNSARKKTLGDKAPGGFSSDGR
jgi:hypothetical protein